MTTTNNLNMVAYAIIDSSTLQSQNSQTILYQISKKATMIVYRDKTEIDYKSNAKLFLDVTREYEFDKILLHSDADLAIKLGADGVHLTSRQADKIRYAKDNNLFVVISTHNKEEALKAQLLGADMVTISPIFNSPNKGKPIGVDSLKDVCDAIEIPVIALGGILALSQIEECANVGAAGFASIRYFQ